MPASYAHYTFGSHVLAKLTDKHLKELLLVQRPLFDLGLHGPDILFYYKPLFPNHVMKTGHALHHQPAMEFMEHARLTVRHAAEGDSTLAYILGFICHFVLDSECHSYVNEMQERLTLSHSKIESEFERYLMKAKHLDPLLTKTTDHLVESEFNAKQIAPFYRGISRIEIKDAIHYFKTYSNLLMAPKKWQRFLLNFAFRLTGHYDFMHGLIIGYTAEPKCDKTNFELYRRYKKAIPAAVELITEFYKNIDEDSELHKRYERDFE